MDELLKSMAWMLFLVALVWTANIFTSVDLNPEDKSQVWAAVTPVYGDITEIKDQVTKGTWGPQDQVGYAYGGFNDCKCECP